MEAAASATCWGNIPATGHPIVRSKSFQFEHSHYLRFQVCKLGLDHKYLPEFRGHKQFVMH